MDAYVDDLQALSPQERKAQIERELALAVPNPQQAYAFSGGVWSASPEVQSPIFRGDNRSSRQVPTERLRQGGAMNVTVHFDMGQGVPIYHVILEPLDFSASVMDRWSSYIVLDTGLNRRDGTDEKIYAPLAGATRTDDGRLITKWILCGSCLAGRPAGGKDAQLELLHKYAKELRGVDLTWPSQQNYRRVFVADAAPSDLKIGPQAVQMAQWTAREAEGAVQRRTAARAASKEANRAYSAFFRTEYRPLSFAGYAKRSDCPGYYEIVSIYGASSAEHAQGARDIERYARCQARLLENYDIEAYMNRYPGFVQQERTLWAKTFNMKRRKILTPRQQLNVAKKRIRNAYADADDSWDRADRVARDTAKRRAEQERTRQVFTRNQALIDAWQRDVASGSTASGDRAGVASVGSAASGAASGAATGARSSSTGQFKLRRYAPVEMDPIPEDQLTVSPNSPYEPQDYSKGTPSPKRPGCDGCVVVH